MAQRVVGIDLGSYSVKAVTLAPRAKATRSSSKQGFEVLGYGEALVPPPTEGTDASTTLRERQGLALAELKKKGLLEGDLFVTGLPGDAAATKTLLFPFSDKEKVAEALPYTLEAEIALDLDDIVYTWSQLPSAGKEAEVLCAFARREVVQEVLDTLAVHDVDPRHVELDALALDDLWDGLFAVAHDPGVDGPGALGMTSGITTPGGTLIETADGAPVPAVAIIDIGHRRTNICVLNRGVVVSAHTILHGGADATRALAKEIGLPLEEAERGKRKEAFIEVAGAVAQFPEQHQISDVLKKAYAPIVRRIRQTFQATIASSRLRVVKVVLTGGGSKLLNLDRWLAEELNVKVARGREVGATLRASTFAGQNPLLGEGDDGVEAATAFAFALSGLAGGRTNARLDFRVGPFAWAGDYDFLRERLPAIGAWAAAIAFVAVLGSVGQLVMLGREASDLSAKQLAICKEILGYDESSPSKCESLIRAQIDGTAGFQVPERSAVDTFLELSRRMPYADAMKRKVTDLDIATDRLRIKGTTAEFGAVDKIVEKLKGAKCFTKVEKGSERQTSSGVEMNITAELDCAAAPGDGELPPPPPGPSKLSSSSSSPSKPSYTAKPEPAEPAEPVMPRSAKLEEASGNAEVSDGPKRPSPGDIEARKERLKKLREEREARRRQLLDSPVARPALRDRLQKPGALPLDRDGAEEGDE